MSAFGKRPGLNSSRPAFGVARPMSGATGSAGGQNRNSDPFGDILAPKGGEQFPAIDSLDLNPGQQANTQSDAMMRLAERASNSGEIEAAAEGFEASVHRIKEQVLPRLLERVDPEAAASLNKEIKS